MRKFKHIPTGKEYRLTTPGRYIIPIGELLRSKDTLPLWVTLNSKDWEEIIEKEWEILTLQGSKNNAIPGCIIPIINGKVHGIYDLDEHINKYKFHGNSHIHSVKRLSDGEVFTVGDNTSSGIIKGFSINSWIMNVEFGMKMHSICNSGFAKIKKQLLFTTEDGVEMFEGDRYVKVNINNFWKSEHSANEYSTIDNNHKTFLTREKAEEYIVMNKPCLSINDITNLFDLEEDGNWKLKSLVKTKINK